MIGPVLPSRYHDSGTGFPSGILPYDWTTGDSYRRTRVTVPAGTNSIPVEGAPWQGLLNIHSADVYIDNVYSQTFTWGGTIGVKETKTLTLDGATHTIDFEEQQVAITNVSGAAVLVLDSPPPNYIVIPGDSITEGVGATTPSLAYGPQVRRALPSGYGVDIWGITGKTFFVLANGVQQNSIQFALQRCIGTQKNIIVAALSINDVLIGVTQTQFQVATNTVVSAILASSVPGLKCLLVSPSQTTSAPGPGITFAQVNTIFAAAAAANPTKIFYLDHSNLYPGSSPWALYLNDGLHPNNLGHGSYWEPSILNAALAL